jgi:hypothetical protein
MLLHNSCKKYAEPSQKAPGEIEHMPRTWQRLLMGSVLQALSRQHLSHAALVGWGVRWDACLRSSGSSGCVV